MAALTGQVWSTIGGIRTKFETFDAAGTVEKMGSAIISPVTSICRLGWGNEQCTRSNMANGISSTVNNVRDAIYTIDITPNPSLWKDITSKFTPVENDQSYGDGVVRFSDVEDPNGSSHMVCAWFDELTHVWSAEGCSSSILRQRGGDIGGDVDGDGDGDGIRCECSHLTDFALLFMSEYELEMVLQHRFVSWMYRGVFAAYAFTVGVAVMTYRWAVRLGVGSAMGVGMASARNTLRYLLTLVSLMCACRMISSLMFGWNIVDLLLHSIFAISHPNAQRFVLLLLATIPQMMLCWIYTYTAILLFSRYIAV